jgi:KDO2-lipid IV(A) lauroyltransferase
MEFLLKTFLRLLSFIPFNFQMLLGKLLGKLLYKALEKRRKVVIWNIHKCFPDMNKKEIEKLARENFTRIGQAIFEICNSYYWSDEKFKKRLKILMNLKKK